MRKVLFKRWIPNQFSDTYPRQTIQGTGCFEKEYTNNGLFHQWAAKFEEFESGAGNYTVAIVEFVDGSIEEVLPSNIKFDDKLALAYS